jgi:hypothetical protein
MVANDKAPCLDDCVVWKSIVGTPPGAGALLQLDRAQTYNQVGCQAASLWLWLFDFLALYREAEWRFCAGFSK